MQKKLKRGFTLIELIVVLAILAIVAAIAVPTAYGSLQKARNAAAVSSIQSLQSVFRTSETLRKGQNNQAAPTTVTVDLQGNAADGFSYRKTGADTQEIWRFMKESFNASAVYFPDQASCNVWMHYVPLTQTVVNQTVYYYPNGDYTTLPMYFYTSVPILGYASEPGYYYSKDGQTFEKIAD